MFRLFNQPLSIRRKGRTFLPRLEVLEDRTVPSTLTVTSAAGSGPGSLRAVIGAAHDGDTIDFAHSLSGKTINLSTELAFSTSLSIRGLGAGHLTISGNDVTRVFDISGGTTTIADLTIADGFVTGQLPSSMVGVFAGTGSGAGGGGGILSQAGANLTLLRDTVRDNTASGAVGYTEVGGGLLNLGTAAVLSCEFANNQAIGGGALDAIGGSAGGGIDNFGGPTGGARLTVTSSTFHDNTASAAGGGYYFGIGGAIDDNAGLNGFDPTQAKGSSAVITDSVVRDNLATGGAGAIGDGGGICYEGDGSTGTMTGCLVTGNRSVGGDGGDGVSTGDSQGVGGGILNSGLLNVVRCVITNNQAIAGKNASINAGDPFTAGAFGGGIENNLNAVLNISSSLIADNLAQGWGNVPRPRRQRSGRRHFQQPHRHHEHDRLRRHGQPRGRRPGRPGRQPAARHDAGRLRLRRRYRPLQQRVIRHHPRQRHHRQRGHRRHRWRGQQRRQRLRRRHRCRMGALHRSAWGLAPDAD
jgi:hypothetical protein